MKSKNPAAVEAVAYYIKDNIVGQITDIDGGPPHAVYFGDPSFCWIDPSLKYHDGVGKLPKFKMVRGPKGVSVQILGIVHYEIKQDAT